MVVRAQFSDIGKWHEFWCRVVYVVHCIMVCWLDYNLFMKLVDV